MRRATFVAAAAAAAAAAPAAAALGQTPAPLEPQTENTRAPVADLRFGFAPLPAAKPGFDPAGDARALLAPGTISPAAAPIPGDQWTGILPGGGRYVLRVPANWNGTLVVAGTPATRSEFANDAIWSDFVLARGAAFASSNKRIPYNAIVAPIAGIPQPEFAYPIPFDAGGLETKGLAIRFGMFDPARIGIAQWNDDFHALAVTMRTLLGAEYRAPQHVYAVGLSNGGAQVRSLLERHPDDVDGGVDWSGVFWSATTTLLDYLPVFLAAMPEYVRSGFTDRRIPERLAKFGFPPDVVQADPAHPSLYADYYSNVAPFYADLTLFAYARLIDRRTSSLAGPCTPDAQNPKLLPGTCSGTGLARPHVRTTYEPSADARKAIAAFAHDGAIEKPLISIAGTRDPFVTPELNAVAYQRAISARRRGRLHRLFLVEGGTHVDTFTAFGYGLRAQLPFAWAAFDRLVRTVEANDTAGTGRVVTVSSPSQLA
jgi:pimeloyl-ACP methyl ester carboxylesterase